MPSLLRNPHHIRAGGLCMVFTVSLSPLDPSPPKIFGGCIYFFRFIA